MVGYNGDGYKFKMLVDERDTINTIISSLKEVQCEVQTKTLCIQSCSKWMMASECLHKIEFNVY